MQTYLVFVDGRKCDTWGQASSPEAMWEMAYDAYGSDLLGIAGREMRVLGDIENTSAVFQLTGSWGKPGNAMVPVAAVVHADSAEEAAAIWRAAYPDQTLNEVASCAWVMG